MSCVVSAALSPGPGNEAAALATVLGSTIVETSVTQTCNIRGPRGCWRAKASCTGAVCVASVLPTRQAHVAVVRAVVLGSTIVGNQERRSLIIRGLRAFKLV